MKLENVEEAINSYFKNISPQEVVDKFIKWGYELKDIKKEINNDKI